MQATLHSEPIAQSDRTVEHGGYTYFPRSAVRMELLRTAAKSERDLECPHGVQFYDVAAGGAHARRAAWSYEAPGAGRQHIDHWIGFWGDVKIG